MTDGLIRRLASALPLAVLLAGPLQAQAGQETRIGPFGAINFATFGGSDVGDVDTRTGVQAGVFASFPLSRYLALVPAASYSQEGASVDVGGGVTGTFLLDYLEVPVLLKLTAPLEGHPQLRPWIMAGPSVGFQLSCKVRAENSSQTAEGDCNDANVNAATKSVAFSGVLGVGMDVGRFTVGLRYQAGLSSIDDSGADADVKNRVLALAVGYGFRLGH